MRFSSIQALSNVTQAFLHQVLYLDLKYWDFYLQNGKYYGSLKQKNVQI